MTVKLPKKIGRSYPYYAAEISIFRTRVSKLDAVTNKLIRYPREYVMTIKPVLFKEKGEAAAYVKQIAYANREAGMYDWSFAVAWVGVQNAKAMEDAGRANNGHTCPRCGRMTLQGGAQDICEGCSTAKA